MCHAIDILAVTQTSLRLRVRCGAGYYVRALGRDLARALVTRGHLCALRRTRSGTHDVAHALDGDVLLRARTDDAARTAVRAALVPLAAATSPIPVLSCDDATIEMLRVGKRPEAPAGASDEPSLVFDPDGALVAIVERREGTLRVVRGFAWRATATPSDRR